jgi:hypothetical protein
MWLTLFILAASLVLLLKWNSDGHIVLTRNGLDKALARLTDQKMRSLGVSRGSRWRR